MEQTEELENFREEWREDIAAAKQRIIHSQKLLSAIMLAPTAMDSSTQLMLANTPRLYFVFPLEMSVVYTKEDPISQALQDEVTMTLAVIVAHHLVHPFLVVHASSPLANSSTTTTSLDSEPPVPYPQMQVITLRTPVNIISSDREPNLKKGLIWIAEALWQMGIYLVVKKSLNWKVGTKGLRRNIVKKFGGPTVATRPRQIECQNMLRHSYCKYRHRCRYDHHTPRLQAMMDAWAINPRTPNPADDVNLGIIGEWPKTAGILVDWERRNQATAEDIRKLTRGEELDHIFTHSFELLQLPTEKKPKRVWIPSDEFSKDKELRKGHETSAEGSEVLAEGSEVVIEGTEIMMEGSKVSAEDSEVVMEGSQVVADAN